MSATQRGAVIFGGFVLFLVACALVTFSVLPSAGIAVGLPVISVPGEAYNGALPSQDFNLTNTIMAVILTDIIVLLILFFAWRASKGWKREVPTGFQGGVELIGEFVYGQAKNFAGTGKLVRQWLFPLAASIFLFLLIANWMKLLPGVESIGVWHCAHEGFAGYPGVQTGLGYQLYVDQPLYAGEGATHEDYENCHHWFEAGGPVPSAEERNTVANHLFDEEGALVQRLTAEGVPAEEQQAQIEELRLHATEELWAHPSFALSADDLRKGVIPYVQVVTPFVRGAATDLNLTIGLALVAVAAVQIFGVAALGPNYFQKFVNLQALGNLQKKPLGAIDFVVGLIEIISEIGKIISLAFRLFGNMFAGGILLAVMSFLVALLLPSVFIGLEVIVTTIQAFVFAVLTMVFSGQAMTAHHSDDDDHHHDDAHEGHAVEAASAH